VASSTHGGLVRVFDPAKGESISPRDGCLNAVFTSRIGDAGRNRDRASDL